MFPLNQFILQFDLPRNALAIEEAVVITEDDLDTLRVVNLSRRPNRQEYIKIVSILDKIIRGDNEAKRVAAINFKDALKRGENLACTRQALYNALMGRCVAVGLDLYTMNVCAFTHNESINQSLAQYNVRRSTPRERGPSALRGVCSSCSEIITGLVQADGVLCYRSCDCEALLKGTNMLPAIVDASLTLRQPTAHISKLFETFLDVIHDATATTVPAASTFVLEVVAYLCYMNGEKRATDFVDPLECHSPSFTQTIIAMMARLDALNVPRSLDPRYFSREKFYKRGQLIKTITPMLSQTGLVEITIENGVSPVLENTRAGC